jgi:aminotransferase
MTRIANEYGAINLAQGFPDFDPPAELVRRLHEAADEGPHQYEITWGSKAFRDQLVAKQGPRMNLPLNGEDNVVVTCGSTEAMMTAMMTVCDPGDKVIIFSPYYENYWADVVLTGAQPAFVSLKPPTFEFDRDELANAFIGAKALVLCNPSNPCGRVFTRSELEYIAELAIKNDAFVITDEVYEHFVYKPYEHIYMASLPGMFERTVSCSSLSKTYSVCGWRLGYVIATREIINGARKVHDFLTVGAPAPLQKAAVHGLLFDQKYYDWLIGEYERKRRLFCDGLASIGFKFVEPQGAYYVLIDIGEVNQFKTDTEFCGWLAKEIGVAAVPGSSFFREEENRYIRLHFAKKDQTLIDALARLEKMRSHFIK